MRSPPFAVIWNTAGGQTGEGGPPFFRLYGDLARRVGLAAGGGGRDTFPADVICQPRGMLWNGIPW